MTTETPATEAQPTTATETQPDPGKLSFSDYEKFRRGESVKAMEQAQSAPEAKATEQKVDAGNSEAPATEENADSTKETSESHEDTSPEDKSAQEDKKPKKGGIQKRFDKLTLEKTQLAQEVEYWKQAALKSANRSETKTEDASKPAAKADEGKPTPDKYETHAEYVEALTDWKTDQKLKERDQKHEREKVQTEQQKVVQTYQERLSAFKAKTPDFSEVEADLTDALAAARVGINPAMERVFLTSENGPELAYQLAKDPEEFVRISKLDPVRAAVEMGKFQAKLEAKTSESKQTNKVTKAPNPIEPAGSGKGSVAKSIDDPGLSFSEYEKLRLKQMERRRA